MGQCLWSPKRLSNKVSDNAELKNEKGVISLFFGVSLPRTRHYSELGTISGMGDLLETLGGEPSVNLRPADQHDVETRLGGNDGHITIGLDKHPFEHIQAGDQLVEEIQAFEVFQRGGFPQLKAAGVFAGRNQGEFDAGGKAKDAIAGDFEVTIRDGVMEPIVFLPAAHWNRGKQIGRQQQAQTFCPFTKVSFLPGDSGRPRCAAIWR